MRQNCVKTFVLRPERNLAKNATTQKKNAEPTELEVVFVVRATKDIMDILTDAMLEAVSDKLSLWSATFIKLLNISFVAWQCYQDVRKNDAKAFVSSICLFIYLFIYLSFSFNLSFLAPSSI